MPDTQTDMIEGLTTSVAVKAPCTVATTGPITLSGAQTVDGVAVTETTPPKRVLVQSQADTTQNGIYDVKNGAWTRSLDFNGTRDAVQGTIVYVLGGTQSKAFQVSTTASPIIFGTSAITFTPANFAITPSIPSLSTVAALRAFVYPALFVGHSVQLNGYFSYGDTPSRLYSVFAGSPPIADDGGRYITSAVSGFYYVLQQPSQTIEATWYGVLGGGTDDTVAIQRTLNSVMSNGAANTSASISFPLGSRLSAPVWYGGFPEYSLVLSSPTGGSRGEVLPTWRWIGPAATSMFILMGASETILEGMVFDGNSSTNGVQNLVHVAATTVATTLSAPVAAGSAVTASVGATTDMVAGAAIPIGIGTAQWEIVYIISVGAGSFAANFKNAHLSGAQVGGNVGSEGVKLKRCGFQVSSIAKGGASVCGLLLGNLTSSGTPDVAIGNVEDCNFSSNITPGLCYAGIRIITGGNVKDWSILGGRCEGFQRAIAGENVNGTLKIIGMEFLNGTAADIYIRGGPPSVSIIGCGSEAYTSGTGTRFLDAASAGANPMSIAVTSCNVQSPAPSDDYLIVALCSITLTTNLFTNSRTGSSVAKVQGGGLTTVTSGIDSSQITSIGNYYGNAGPGITVFFDSGNNPISPNGNTVVQSLRVLSQGDYGTTGSLPPYQGQISLIGAALALNNLTAGVLVPFTGRPSVAFTQVILPASVFSGAAALTLDATVLRVPIGTRIVSVLAQVTTAFTGPTGPLNFVVGTTAGGAELLASFAAGSVANFGLADADMGTAMTRAAMVQGGDMALWAAGGIINVRLTSSSGNLTGLVGGSLRLLIETSRVLLTA